MMVKIKIINKLRELYGPEVTNLDKVSIEVICEGLLIEEWVEKEKWATYNQLLLEFKKYGDKVKLEKLQYYLSDKGNPKDVCLRMISEIDNKSKEMLRLYEKISIF